MKTNLLYFCVLALILCCTEVLAQPGCRMRRILIRRGQRVCQRMCYPRPHIRCYTSRFGENIALCPRNCCRIAQLVRCRVYRVVLRPGQRVCQRMCYPIGGRACYTARRVESQTLCHPSCCRLGNRCQQLLYA